MMCNRRKVESVIWAVLFGALSGCSHEASLEKGVRLELRTSEVSPPETPGNTLSEAFAATAAFTTIESNYSDLTGSYEGVRDISVKTDGSVAWNSSAYYPADGSWLWLVAFSPTAVPSSGQVTYTLSGKEDLLYASQLRGSRWDGERFSGNTDSSLDRPLAFSHLLTCLHFFACKAGQEGIPVKITKITVKEAPGTATLSLATGTIVFGAPTGLTLTLPENAPEVSGTAAVDLGKLILPPLAAAGTDGYTLEVETSLGTYDNIPINFKGSNASELLRPGILHEITLTLSDYDLLITSVKAAPWPTIEMNGELDLIQ